MSCMSYISLRGLWEDVQLVQNLNEIYNGYRNGSVRLKGEALKKPKRIHMLKVPRKYRSNNSLINESVIYNHIYFIIWRLYAHS